eukprot:CAMPEP_0172895480 /NCGR_PEP_ID=MMETSP1075-20121228/153193_1 /TAXON_ID=2916 /ORGANISM="Ceratium fusus, Strain PA161109" /LENGTH=66 /DNA_ID=CAMNT_0013750699 /DNA_START=237 /DNA_END=434 /DNA_ORIENTATION=-
MRGLASSFFGGGPKVVDKPSAALLNEYSPGPGLSAMLDGLNPVDRGTSKGSRRLSDEHRSELDRNA